jgi:hypothetical protein
MKIKKNGIIVNLSESDLRVIVKKHLKENSSINEGKVNFSYCMEDYPEWLNSHTSEWGEAGRVLRHKEGKVNIVTMIKKYLKSKFFVGTLGTCDILKDKEVFNAGIFSKISDKGWKERALTRTVQYCRKHIDTVVEDLEKGNVKNVWGNESHIKPEVIEKINDGTMFNGVGKGKYLDEFVETPEFKKEIEKLKKISKCLKAKIF